MTKLSLREQNMRGLLGEAATMCKSWGALMKLRADACRQLACPQPHLPPWPTPAEERLEEALSLEHEFLAALADLLAAHAKQLKGGA